MPKEQYLPAIPAPSSIVAPGQVWSFLEPNGERRTFTVERLCYGPRRVRYARGKDTRGKICMCPCYRLETGDMDARREA